MDIPFIRLTVVGAEGVGKTRVIDSFVNNTRITDYWHADSTPRSQFYYRLLVLEPKSGLAVTEERISCLLEIEDTPPSTFTQLRDSDAGQSHGYEDLKLRHPSINFVKYEQVNRLYMNDEEGKQMPFGNMEYNRIVKDDRTVEERALTQGRMGFAIVFSLCDPRSFDEAVEIHTAIRLIHERFDMPILPVMLLLGNKVEIAGRSEHKPLKRRAQDYA